jgi:hypothetical protein
VRQPSHPTVKVRPLELLTTGPPDSPVVHWTVVVHYPVCLLAPAMTSARTVCTVHSYCTLLQTTVSVVAVTPLGTPDSPVNYSGEHFPETQS